MNPNTLFAMPRDTGKTLAQMAKGSLKLLERAGVIRDFDYEVNRHGVITGFLLWPVTLDDDPLHLTPGEADAFARGARAQHLWDEGRVPA